MLVGGDAPLGRGVVRRGLEAPPEGEDFSEVYQLLGIHPSFSAAGAHAGRTGLSWPSRLVQQAQLLQFGVEFAGGLTLLRFCFTQEDRRKYAFYFQWRCFDLRPEWRVVARVSVAGIALLVRLLRVHRRYLSPGELCGR